MSVYAAMITAMDAQISRVIAALEEAGRLENTLIVFLSDNGPEGGNPLDWADSYTDWAVRNFDLSLENMGRPYSFAWTGPRWAEVSATPFHLFKGFASEGGTRVPAIVNWPAALTRVGITNEFLHVLDLPATLLDVANVEHPGTRTTGHGSRELEGRVLTSFLTTHDSSLEEPVNTWEMFDRRAVRVGDWKMTYANAPWGKEGEWSLFNMREDSGETKDVISKHPEVASRLLEKWEQYVEDNGLIVLKGGLDLRWTNMFTHFEWMPVPASVSHTRNVKNSPSQRELIAE
jgi:arylsulfatase